MRANEYAELAHIRSRLRGVTGSAEKFMAFCPAHDDQINRSLSVTLAASGKVLMHCFAGCSYDHLRAALGLSVYRRIRR